MVWEGIHSSGCLSGAFMQNHSTYSAFSRKEHRSNLSHYPLSEQLSDVKSTVEFCIPGIYTTLMESRCQCDHSRTLLAICSNWAEHTQPWQSIYTVMLSVFTMTYLSVSSGAKCFNIIGLEEDSSRKCMWRDGVFFHLAPTTSEPHIPPQLQRIASMYTNIRDITLLRRTPIDWTEGVFQYRRSDCSEGEMVSIKLMCQIGSRCRWLNCLWIFIMFRSLKGTTT